MLLTPEGGGLSSESGSRGATIGEKIGVATAKRAVISRSILQGADAATDGRLLGEIDAKLDSPGLAPNSGVKNTQYSEGDTQGSNAKGITTTLKISSDLCGNAHKIWKQQTP